MPFHVWLPEAHPAAPSHVSALMSGVMIKTGIYGLVRVLMLLDEPQLWWGWLLLALGGASAFLGVLLALAQHDLKRLLAYCSIENIGIIVLGLGVGVVGLASQAPVVAALGFAGALLHVVNHAIFKGLLFMGAGSVIKATGTGEVDELGGVLRRMPVTGATFLVGSVAICGLPPLNGFVSELLIYWSGFVGATQLGAWAAMPLGATVVVLGGCGRPGARRVHEGLRHRLPRLAAQREERRGLGHAVLDARGDGRARGGLRRDRPRLRRSSCRGSPRSSARSGRAAPRRRSRRRARCWRRSASSRSACWRSSRSWPWCAGCCWPGAR